MAVTPLSRGGSGRNFYRLKWDGRSVFLMHYSDERRENAFYAPIGRFLRDIGVAVPEIFHHDAERGFLLMEDLGDDDLWSCRLAPWNIRRGLYQETLRVIGQLHAYAIDTFPYASVPLMEGFDGSLYRWERDYFRENFVTGVCGIECPPSEAKVLEIELNALASRLMAMQPALIHRDFQSQNIMIRSGSPILIDFQGMRMGNPFYDLGSLLYDPYVTLGDDERMALLSYYFGISGNGSAWPAFREYFLEASAQRLMQALGAYGFLGLKKGRTAFLGYIDSGLRNLEDVTKQAANLPALQVLAARCREIVGEGVAPNCIDTL